ncbi:Fc.00g001730.m01.CDS01 [Cosmosporella sp. VM-42]
MGGPNADSFQRALKKFKQSLSQDLINQFSISTLQDVRQVCHDIQQEHGNEGKLRNMRRLEGFIEAMEHLGKVMEVFLNVHELVCFIWGPVKLLLSIARTYLDSFDKLLDVYSQLGDAIPGLQSYQSAFEKHPSLAVVLEDYYSDILEFHQAAISVFRQTKWQKMFRSTWKTFDSEFRPILQSLKHRRELLESEKGSASLYEIQKLRDDFARRIVMEDDEKHRKRVSHIRQKLQAPNYQIDQEFSSENRNGTNSGIWMTENVTFKKWADEDEARHDVLYVNGIPGAGKTTLMSSVIEHLLSDKLSKGKNICVAYFYFKNQQPDKVSHNGVLRGILDQLIDQDPTMSDHLFEEISCLEGVNLRLTKKLEEVVKGVFESRRISYLVLDGLDECSSDEAEKTIKWFLSLINGRPNVASAALRILFCGQRDGVLDKLLADFSSIALDTSGHVEDIRRYCRDFCERIQQKFHITSTKKDEIISRVSEKAQGMFLYARVVLENLLNQTRRSRLFREIEPGTFPDGLEQAYERVGLRIFENSSSAEREDAATILGWVTSARRSLRWREIQSLVCIDPVNGVVDYEDRLRVTCKELCGSLVDLHHTSNNKRGPEAIVQIVHETAREYLVKRRWLNTSLEHAKLAMFCSQYLTSGPFRYEIDEDDIDKYASKGYYSFQDYAVKYWFDHLQKCAEPVEALNQRQFEEAMECAHDILSSYGRSSMIGDYGKRSEPAKVSRALLRLPEEPSERNTYFDIELRTKVIRERIEALQGQILDPAVQEMFTNLHGTVGPYKCSKTWCDSFTAGFESDGCRNRHISDHELPFRCPFMDCFAAKLGYATPFRLEQHQKQHHAQSDNQILFPEMAKKSVNIWTAAAKGDTARVRAQLDAGQDINKLSGRRTQLGGKGSPLHLAAQNGAFEVCALLLDRGADINLIRLGMTGRQTPLHAAVHSGNCDIVRLFLSRPDCLPDPEDSMGQTPFCDACARGHLDIVQCLLMTGKVRTDYRPRIHPERYKNAAGRSTSTALGYACIGGHLPVVQYLVQQGHFRHRDIRVRIAMLRHRGIFDLLREEVAKLPRDLHYGYSYFKDPLGFRKDGDGWWTVSNEDAPSAIDVDRYKTFQPDSPAACACFSADGNYLAIADYDAGVRIYDTTTGEERYTFKPEKNGISRVEQPYICLSPDGEHLAISYKDLYVNKSSRREIQASEKMFFPYDLRILYKHQGLVIGLSFVKNSRTLVSSQSYGPIQVWDIETSENILTITPDGITSAVAISHDAGYVAAGCDNGSVRVWNLKTGALTAHLKEQDSSEGPIYSVAFSSGGEELFSDGGDKTVKKWKLDVAQGEHPDPLSHHGGRCVKTFQSHANSVEYIAVTPDNGWLLSGSRDRCLRFWDPTTGQCQLLIGGFKSNGMSVAVSPKGSLFATVDYVARDNTNVRLWSYGTPKASSSTK